MKPEIARLLNDTPFPQYLYMAIELSNEKRKVAFTIGFGQQPRLHNLSEVMSRVSANTKGEVPSKSNGECWFGPVRLLRLGRHDPGPAADGGAILLRK